MKKTNIYLSLRGSKSSESRPIKFLISINSKKKEVNTGYRVSERQWNSKTKNVIKHNNSGIINNKLNRWQNKIDEFLLEHPFSDYKKSEEQILEIMGKKTNSNETHGFLIEWKKYIDRKTYSKSTYKTLISCYSKFKRYCQLSKLNPQHKDIDNIFLEEYKNFLITRGRVLSSEGKPSGLTNNTVIKYTKYIKQYLEDTLGTIHNNDRFKKFKIKSPPSIPITLTKNEIKAIENLNLHGSKEKVRDCVLFCYYTFQRFGDIVNLDFKEIDLDQKDWNFRQSKTKHTIKIPLNEKAYDIIIKYIKNGKLPTISNQKTNSILKSICKEAGIDREIMRSFVIGAYTYKETHPKYKLISTHTMRRSAITHALKSNVPRHIVQALSGHQSIREMDKYIDKSSEEVQEYREVLA